jgi:hypothetical protein
MFLSHVAEECTEEAVSCMSKLYSALEVEGGIGRNIQNTKLRAHVLKTLYKFVESSNEVLLLRIARIILAVSNSCILHPVVRVSAKLIKVLLHRTQPQFIAFTSLYSHNMFRLIHKPSSGVIYKYNILEKLLTFNGSVDLNYSYFFSILYL